MARAKTPSYVIEFKLNLQPFEQHILDKAFEVARITYNTCLSMAMKRSNQVKHTKEFQRLRALPQSKERTQFKELEKNMASMNTVYMQQLLIQKDILGI